MAQARKRETKPGDTDESAPTLSLESGCCSSARGAQITEEEERDGKTVYFVQKRDKAAGRFEKREGLLDSGLLRQLLSVWERKTSRGACAPGRQAEGSALGSLTSPSLRHKGDG